MTDGKKKTPTARETSGEGVTKEVRKDSGRTAEERANPSRDEESSDARLIDRRRDARNPQGI